MSQSEESSPSPPKQSAEKGKVSAGFDAREYLELTLKQRVDDVMTIRQIPHTCAYRINWYDRAVVGQSAVVGMSIRYIRKSKFLYCYLDQDGKPTIKYPPQQ